MQTRARLLSRKLRRALFPRQLGNSVRTAMSPSPQMVFDMHVPLTWFIGHHMHTTAYLKTLSSASQLHQISSAHVSPPADNCQYSYCNQLSVPHIPHGLPCVALVGNSHERVDVDLDVMSFTIRHKGDHNCDECTDLKDNTPVEHIDGEGKVGRILAISACTCMFARVRVLTERTTSASAWYPIPMLSVK